MSAVYPVTSTYCKFDHNRSVNVKEEEDRLDCCCQEGVTTEPDLSAGVFVFICSQINETVSHVLRSILSF